MWLILLCSVVSIAVFTERLLYFHRATINLGEFLQGLSNLVRKRNLAEARVECQALTSRTGNPGHPRSADPP